MFNEDCVTTSLTAEEFWETAESDKVIVKKNINEFLCTTDIIYVYAYEGAELPSYALFREESEDGTDFWKETYRVEI